MGQELSENKKLINPDFQDSVNESNKNIIEIENEMKEDLEYLSDCIQHLEEQQDYLETIKVVAGEGLSSVFNQNDIEKVKINIENIKKNIKKINNSISEWTLYKIQLQSQIDEFHKLDKEFKDILLKINPENLQ